MQVSTFYEKLNKVDGNIYVVEEEIHFTNGVYEAELQHDNINEATFAVFTGPKLTGTRLETYTLSTPSLAPWKRIVRVYADVPVAYISYETDGDTVEGDDINRVQAAVVETQKALNTEGARSLSAEMELNGRIDTEVKRAEDAELTLRNDLTAEVTRAKAAEKTNADNLATESTRAKAAEKTLTNNLDSEITRAKAAEKSIGDAVNTEKSRATAAEEAIQNTIGINKPNWDDKYTRNEVDNKLSALETAVDWKEAVSTYADLATTYPHPDDGWTVNVKDTNYTYRWSGTAWIAISANAIPKATQSVDGLLSKEDKTRYDDAYSKRHTHTNKSTLDKLTETLLSNWTDAYNKRHEHANKTVLDDITRAMLEKLAGIAEGANKYVHPTTAGNKHIPSGGASGQVLRWSADGTAEWGADSNSDTKVTQTNTTGSADYRMVLSGNANDSTETNTARKSANFLANPATGELYAKGFRRTNITGQTLDINTLNLSSGAPCIMRYIEKTCGGAANITNIPAAGQPFLLDVELIRWASAADYITIQTFRSAANQTNEYVRFCKNGTWNDWTTRVFSDTKYSHPSSGVTAGTYRSVTVNAQGHVTAGTNPTTLVGYGITDAAAKNHNHDSTYLKKGAVTWNDLKGCTERHYTAVASTPRKDQAPLSRRNILWTWRGMPHPSWQKSERWRRYTGHRGMR